MICTEGLQAVEGQANTYDIRARRPLDLRRCKANPIVLTSTDPNIPLPNPTYLKIHASCCRVAQMSGAADYIDQTSGSDDNGSAKLFLDMTWVDILMLSPAFFYCFVYVLLSQSIRRVVLRINNTQNVAVASA
jgi:hypothetical protein